MRMVNSKEWVVYVALLGRGTKYRSAAALSLLFGLERCSQDQWLSMGSILDLLSHMTLSATLSNYIVMF